MTRWSKIGAASLVLSVLAGCGGQSNAGDAAPAAGELTGRGPITFATGQDRTGGLQKIIAKWNQQHADEQVRLLELPEAADDKRQQIIQNAETKSDALNVVDTDVVWTAEFAANRWIVPLPKEQFALDRNLQPALATGLYRDNLYAAPWYTDAGLLYYRKDLLDKVGAKPPTTWAEMRSICTKVLAAPTAKGMSCYAGQFEKYEGLTVNFSEMVTGAGGQIVDKAGNPAVDTPEARAGVEFFVKAFQSGLIPKKAISFKEEEGRRSFQQGELVFHRQWPYQWVIANKTDGSSKVAGKFAVAPLPGLNGPGVSSLGGHNLAITAATKNKATALDFIKFMTSPENQTEHLLVASRAPTISALYDDPKLVAEYPYMPVLKQAVLAARPRPQVARYGDTTAAIQQAAYDLLTGAASTDAALSDLQQKLEEISGP